ncbi:MAG TPA: winged helix-turn-helix domain-containing protein [Trebonia sp.]
MPLRARAGGGRWPAGPFTTAVKSVIRRLRLKLGDPPLVHTVREGGYRVGKP